MPSNVADAPTPRSEYDSATHARKNTNVMWTRIGMPATLPMLAARSRVIGFASQCAPACIARDVQAGHLLRHVVVAILPLRCLDHRERVDRVARLREALAKDHE